jgi:hypothetical protein
MSHLEPMKLVLTSVRKKKSVDGSFFYFRAPGQTQMKISPRRRPRAMYAQLK